MPRGRMCTKEPRSSQYSTRPASKNEIVAMTGVTLRASLNNIVASRLVDDCVGRARENPVFNDIAAAREIDGAARQQVHKNLVTAAAY